MKILIISGAFPPDSGSTANYVPWVASSLASRGHSVKVQTLSGAAKHDDSNWPFHVQRLEREDNSKKTRKELQEKIVEAAKLADVVYVNGLAHECSLARKLINKPQVLKVNGDIGWHQARRLQYTADTYEEFRSPGIVPAFELWKLQRNAWARKADRIIVPTVFLRQVVQGWGVPLKNIEIVYPSAQIPEKIREECEKRSQARSLDDWPMRVITASRLVHWKGIDGIIKAVGSIADLAIKVIGEGPDRDRLADTASQLPLANRLTFTGALSRNEIYLQISESDIYIDNSVYEGSPQAAIDAISIGVPVIASNVGAIPEIIAHEFNGLLVPANDHHAIANALLRIRDDKSLRSRLKLGCQQSYDLNNSAWMVEETERVLYEAASGIVRED